MATIRRVTFHRLRNVMPGCTLELHPGLNVLLGQNGTGKTTLLQWMADFLSGDLDKWNKDPYRVEVELEIELEAKQTRLQVTIENQISELTQDREARRSMEAMLELSERPSGSSQLTTHIVIERGEDRYDIEARPPHLSLRANGVTLATSESGHDPGRTSGDPIWWSVLGAESLLSESSHANDRAHEIGVQKASAFLRNIIHALSPFTLMPLTRFDESLGFFHHIVEGREARARMQVSRSSQTFPFPWFVPPEIAARVTRKVRESSDDLQTLTFASEDVQGSLATAVRLFQYRSADIHLSLLEKIVRSAAPLFIYGNLRFTFERHDGSIFGHDKLSYGQKRMLSFLYYLALYPRLIIVDELVNGLHHAWIEACVKEIGDRQGILTSQNPLLLDYLTFESADDVRRRFILCRSERDSETGRDQLIWRNPTLEEAESFYSAYQAGIQQVGEILVDKGFW